MAHTDTERRKMNKSVQKKIREFVKQEQQSPVDEVLLNKLRGNLLLETLYWSLEPEQRNAYNIFFRELTDTFLQEMITGEYGARVILESLVVTAFEAGLRLGKI